MNPPHPHPRPYPHPLPHPLPLPHPGRIVVRPELVSKCHSFKGKSSIWIDMEIGLDNEIVFLNDS